MLPITNSNAIILIESAKKLNLKVKIIQPKPFILEFSKNGQTHRISQKSFHLNTSDQAKAIAKDKALTLQTLALSNIPTPRFTSISTLESYSDINLPFPWDGITLMKELKNKFPIFQQIPFIAQTAYAMNSDKENLLKEGFNDYIAKPIDKAQLYYLIETNIRLS